MTPNPCILLVLYSASRRFSLFTLARGILTRRSLLLGAIAASSSLTHRGLLHAAPALAARERFAALEQQHGGRLGVSALDTGIGRRIGHRADERFPMCSTFKALAAALVLARVDRGEERLDRRVFYTPADLVTYSPATEKRVGPDAGMTMAEICEAAVTLSDNAAGNLLLASFGGPAGLTAYARSLGDEVTRLDRIETALNEATPGDPRDTTSPAAMLELLRKTVLGDALSAASRAQLAAWLVDSKTGDARIRAGFPRGWRIGDKTGTGDNGVANDVAVVWPPDRAALVVCVYYAEANILPAQRNAVIAEAARAVAETL